jgi:hypothetical protein
MTSLTGSPGFTPPKAGQKRTRECAIALNVIATGTLAVSLIIAATAVSMGERSFARGHGSGQGSGSPQILLRQ